MKFWSSLGTLTRIGLIHQLDGTARRMNFYDSYSADLTQIADRRRIGLWIHKKDFEIFDSEDNPIDIQVVQPFTDPFRILRLNSETKIVLDMVDGYLADIPSVIIDYARYFLRSSKVPALIHPMRFSKSLRKICALADMVVVASNEQAELVKPFNGNVRIIRDSHDELGQPLPIKEFSTSSNLNIFWEGLGFTLIHFEDVANDLSEFLVSTNSVLHLVANEFYPRFAGKFGKVKAKKEVKKIFGHAASRIMIHPWSEEMVSAIAAKCDFGIIPINQQNRFAQLKPENKLLIYWRLGLPTLFSDTPSYVRLASDVGVTEYSVKSGEWSGKLLEISEARGCLSENMPKAQEYLLRFHSENLILEQWREALNSLKEQGQLRRSS